MAIKLSKGVIYMIYASFTFALMNVLVKYLSHIPAVELVFFRSLVSFIICVALLKYQNIPLFGNKKKYLISRGFFGMISLLLYFYTLQKIPLAAAATLQLVSPVFTAILGYYFLSEKLHPWQVLFLTLSLTGTIVMKSFDARIETLTLLAGLTSALASAFAYISIRKTGTSEHPLVIVLYFPMIATPISGVLSYNVWIMPEGFDWLLVIGVGVLTQIAQFYMTKAYQIEVANKVASVNYIGIVFAFLFGYFIFGEMLNIQVILGIALVLLGVMLNLNLGRIRLWISKMK